MNQRAKQKAGYSVRNARFQEVERRGGTTSTHEDVDSRLTLVIAQEHKAWEDFIKA
jgi:hypothetical protein